MAKKDWRAIALNSFPTGSRVICSPPVEDTDEDHCALVSLNRMKWFTENGFTQDGSPEFYTGNDAGGFRSFRRGDLNIIATSSGRFFELFRAATELARRFKLNDKADRIALFQVVLYGVDADNLEQPDEWELAS